MDEVNIIESLLSGEHEIEYIEQLKNYLLIKVGSMSSFRAAIREAINCCFNYNVLSNFSYKGKTKNKFTDLKLFMVVYEALSGFRKTPFDEKQFHTVADNYTRHAPKTICIDKVDG
ncbi:unnamed protein product [Macrosiphum euphorbiae]|uniref:DUF4806 domain-containing protein n=2 Tax=Macrosiphum euphorbiae TaxID=13131 RepID=A0AAV0XYZ6_9HEMI|nr:unnamed protein product [Macrosiphum euphorbiae]